MRFITSILTSFFQKGVLCVKYDQFGDGWKKVLTSSLRENKVKT